jgi:hypothetical protein
MSVIMTHSVINKNHNSTGEVKGSRPPTLEPRDQSLMPTACSGKPISYGLHILSSRLLQGGQPQVKVQVLFPDCALNSLGRRLLRPHPKPRKSESPRAGPRPLPFLKVYR